MSCVHIILKFYSPVESKSGIGEFVYLWFYILLKKIFIHLELDSISIWIIDLCLVVVFNSIYFLSPAYLNNFCREPRKKWGLPNQTLSNSVKFYLASCGYWFKKVKKTWWKQPIIHRHQQTKLNLFHGMTRNLIWIVFGEMNSSFRLFTHF